VVRESLAPGRAPSHQAPGSSRDVAPRARSCFFLPPLTGAAGAQRPSLQEKSDATAPPGINNEESHPGNFCCADEAKPLSL